jgi:hypothetical protein
MNNKTPHCIIWLVPFILVLFLSACTINFGSSPPNQRGQNQEQLDDDASDNDDDDDDDDRD